MLTTLIVLASIFPAIYLLLRPRIIVTMVLTIAATWLVSTLSMLMVGETDDIGLVVVIMFVIMPVLLVGTAIFVSTSLAPKPRRISDAGFLAMIGWWFGLIVMLFTIGGSLDDLRAFAAFTAIPSAYAGAGAAFGATNPRT